MLRKLLAIALLIVSCVQAQESDVLALPSGEGNVNENNMQLQLVSYNGINTGTDNYERQQLIEMNKEMLQMHLMLMKQVNASNQKIELLTNALINNNAEKNQLVHEIAAAKNQVIEAKDQVISEKDNKSSGWTPFGKNGGFWSKAGNLAANVGYNVVNSPLFLTNVAIPMVIHLGYNLLLGEGICSKFVRRSLKWFQPAMETTTRRFFGW